MQKLELFFSSTFETYQSLERIIDPIGFLKLFLRDISLHGITSFIQWAEESREVATGTNCMWLEKKPPYILIGSYYTDPKAKIQYFKILIPEFVKVLKEWEKLAKAKTKKITITQADDGIMTIEGE